MPVIAMLAYGWVFHMGFFNYYLSVGFCMGAIALCWKLSPARSILALLLLALAWGAHAVPVVWALFAIAYIAVAQRLRPRYRWLLTATSIGLLMGACLFLRAHCRVNWSPSQNFAITGLDQLVVFGPKYFLVAAAGLILGTLLLIRLIDLRGAWRTSHHPLHLTLCAAAGAFLIPGRILLPGESQAISFVAERWSLIVGLSLCVLLGGVKPGRWHIAGTTAAAALFFSFLYMDEGALNRDEDLMEAAVSTLPAGQRLVAAPDPNRERIAPRLHMVDQACVGKCFSYANYEPSSRAFRIRVRGHNSLVTDNYSDSWAMQSGIYQVRDTDLPLLQISLRGNG